LNRQLLEKLEARKSRVNSSFSYFVEKKAPETGLKGLIDYLVNIESILDGEYFESEVTVNVPVTTLCPCSKAISNRGAHNQRGNVKFSVKSSDPIWIEDLILLVESSASSELYSVLKRPDEKVVTERAYDNPVFVEDLVRNVALKANEMSDINWYKVEAENFESIHNHNAYAVVVKGLK
jgi:GTP cyclohydrolase I